LRIFLINDIFLIKKIIENRKMPTEKEIIEQLQKGKILLSPLSLRLLQVQPETDGNLKFDAFVEASWKNKTARFFVEITANWTPKSFQNAINLLKSSSLPQGRQPMLIMPFLSDQRLQELEREKISGIDLCGNGVVVAPGSFAVFRSGGKNRFTSSAPIKNIYRKNSAMVGRVFLLRSGYGSVQEVRAEINRRNILIQYGAKTPMSLSTVSKSLKVLVEDLIIERNNVIRLLQAEKLLEKLTENYLPPNVKERVRLKVPEGSGTLQELLLTESRKLELPLVAAGTSSVTQYAAMQRGDLLTVYCPRLERFLEKLPGDPSDRFPNLELVETDDETVFFDARQEGNFWWASPVQVYLELMAGDKRDQETAEQVKSLIIKNLQPL
jgi:hypothetical protein